MKARVKILFELPEGVAPIEFQAGISEKVKQEIIGVLLPIKGMGIPDSFKFKEEKEDECDE